jgi:hypothetical protein
MSECTTSVRPGGCSHRQSTRPPRRACPRPSAPCRQLVGVVAHKVDRLDKARARLDAALTLALDAGARTDEAYCRQELGFLLLDTGDPEQALSE